MAPRADVDDLLARTGGDIGKLESELGINPGAWDKPGATLSRIDIPDPRANGLRIPSGAEDGANAHWLPGGRTPGGGLEAVTNEIPKGSYIETLIGSIGR